MSEQDSGALRVEIERRLVWLKEEANTKRDLADAWIGNVNGVAPRAALLDCAEAHDDQIAFLRRCLAALAADPAQLAGSREPCSSDVQQRASGDGSRDPAIRLAQGETARLGLQEATIARLRDKWLAHREAMARDFDAQTAALKRLATYAEHKSYCSKWRNSGDFWHRTPYIDPTLSCNCGLYAVLAEAEQEAR